MKSVNHEVWFKIDNVNPKEAQKINRINLSIASLRKNLKKCFVHFSYDSADMLT